MSEALLVLADGTVFRGRVVRRAGGDVRRDGASTPASPATRRSSPIRRYHGQIVAMTYPHQGNYGLNALDEEAPHPWVRGFVVREATAQPSSWRSTESLAGLSRAPRRRRDRRHRHAATDTPAACRTVR